MPSKQVLGRQNNAVDCGRYGAQPGSTACVASQSPIEDIPYAYRMSLKHMRSGTHCYCQDSSSPAEEHSLKKRKNQKRFLKS